MINLYTKAVISHVFFLFFAIAAFGQQGNNDQPDLKLYRDILTKNSFRLNATPGEINEAVITNSYTDKSTGISYVYLQQAYAGIKIYNCIVSAAFKNETLVNTSGIFIRDIAEKAGSAVPVKTYTQAVKAAATHLGLAVNEPVRLAEDNFAEQKQYVVSPAGIAKRNITVNLVWTPSDDRSKVYLSWNVNIDQINSADWWNVRIDAVTGNYLTKDNWTVNEGESSSATPVKKVTAAVVTTTQNFQVPSANKTLQLPPAISDVTYKVIPFPYDSPNFAPPTNVTNPWLMAGAGNNAITYGWHYDGTTDYTITRGNNVFSFLDVSNNDTPNATNNWPDTSTTAIPSLTFQHTPIFTSQPGNSLNQTNKKFALDNLFYWNNLMHDVMYQYGLTEAGGNFQANNIGRGGAGNDQVMANAQDGGGTNNANFSTPNDGTSGRMQMYLWSGTPVFNVTAPAAVAGSYTAVEDLFTTTVPSSLAATGPINNNVVLYNDDAAGTVHRGCSAATNAAAVLGHIAMLDAFGGSAPCNTYAYKIKNAQNAGAVAVIVYSNTATPINFGGSDAVALTITIPVVCVSNATGTLIMNQLALNNQVNVTLATGISLDGDIDNGIVCHEYGHGVSNRLTGGPSNTSCLTNAEQAGEGWSDYFALMMTTNWATANTTDGPLPRPLGTYAYDQPATGVGIRRYPYSTNLAVNPLTYANMATNTEVHATGEIWCAALWDMIWNIIQQQNEITPNLYNSAGTGGNAIALNLVMTGLKLQPCGPGFLDGRNAILTADSILYNNAHRCAIWAAFARRGMGYSASQGSATSATDQVIATDLPAGLRVAKLTPAQIVANGQLTLTHTATCNCQALTNYVVRDTIPAGFTYVSSTPTGTLSGNVLSFPATNFAPSDVKTFALRLQAPAAGCTVDSLINDNREGSTAGGFTSSGTGTWVTSSTQSYSPPSSWYVPDPNATSSAKLTSAATAASAGQNLSIFSFRHFYNLENTYDGGVIEYSTNAGVTWTDASPLFFPNTYTTTMDAGSALSGRRAFSGSNGAFSPVMINASNFGTTPVQFRFRFESDGSVGSSGWYVDDIQRVNGCGAFLKTGIYNGSNAVQDTTLTPLFVTQSVVALNLLSFNARLNDGHSLLDWHTAAESLQGYGIQWSTDNVTWSTIGNATAKNAGTNDYNFIHPNPSKGNNFYRLKINDLNGAFSYSAIRILNVKEKATQPLIVPNPAGETATLYISKDVKPALVKIYDAIGSVVFTTTMLPGTDQLRIVTANYAAGVYIIEINGSQRFTEKLVVKH